MIDLRKYADPSAVARAAAELTVETARNAVAERGAFTLVLSGGSTPRLLYGLLTAAPFVSQIDWPRVEIYFGDERCVPPDHPDSNYRTAYEALISKIPLDPAKVHRMKGEIDPTAAAIEYGRMLKARFGEIASSTGPDLVLLGMGDDGHTASLFPYTPALDETHHRCVAQFVEKSTTGPSWRITLTARFINSAKLVTPLITGAAKAQRLREALHGQRDPKRLPMQLISPNGGKMLWMVDEAAGRDV
jgi:6-phosphogluconolactonase